MHESDVHGATPYASSNDSDEHSSSDGSSESGVSLSSNNDDENKEWGEVENLNAAEYPDAAEVSDAAEGPNGAEQPDAAEDANAPKAGAGGEDTPNEPGDSSNIYKLKSQIFSAENKALYDMAFNLYKKNQTNNTHIENFNKFLQENGGRFSDIKSLLPHQVQGVNFALHNITQKDIDGCLLAHTMGAGKSIQAMAIMYILQEYYNFKHCLLICPKSMFGTWVREINNLRPWYDKSLSSDTQVTFKEEGKGKKISIYTNESFKSDSTQTTSSLPEEFVDLIVVDEAHSLKNDQSALYGLLDAIKNKVHSGDNNSKAKKGPKDEPARTNFLLLTGTPIHNSVLELMSLCTMLLPSSGKNKEKWTAFRELTSNKSHTSLREFQLKIEKMQSAWQDDASKAMLAEVNQLDNNLSNFIKIIVSPFLHRIGEELIYDNLKVRDGDVQRKLTLTWYNVMFNIDDIKAVETAKDSHTAYLTMSQLSWGIISQDERKETFKTQFLRGFIAQVENVPLEKRRKIIFFHVHTTIAERVEQIIKSEIGLENSGSVQCVDGSSNFGHRETCFKNFNDPNHELRYLILQEQVGGVGVNLQKMGTVVVYLEINFNPALTKQSTARIWRLGQTRDCYAINLITQFSTEMVTYDVNARKNRISLDILDDKKSNDTLIQKTNLKKFREDWKAAETISGGNMPGFLNTHLRHPELHIASPDFKQALLNAKDRNPEVHHDMKDLTELFQVEHTGDEMLDFVVMKPPQENIDVVKTEKEEISIIKHNLDKKIAYVLYVGANNIYQPGDAVRGVIDCNGQLWTRMVEEVRSKLLKRVYFCDRTKYFIYKNGFTDKPPLFWPGWPVLGDQALDNTHVAVEDIDQTSMRIHQYTRQKNQRFPKIHLQIDREQFLQKHGDTANPQKIQSMIDNFHYCFHYPISEYKATKNRVPATWEEFMFIVKTLQHTLVLPGFPEESQEKVDTQHFELFSITDLVADNFFKESAAEEENHIQPPFFPTGDKKKTAKSNNHVGPGAISFEAVQNANTVDFNRITLELTFSALNTKSGAEIPEKKCVHAITLNQFGLCRFTFESNITLLYFFTWCEMFKNIDGLSMLSMTLKRTPAERGVSVFAVIKDGERWWRFDKDLPEVLGIDSCSEMTVLDATFVYSAIAAVDICYDKEGNLLQRTDESRQIEIQVNSKLNLIDSLIKTWVDRGKTDRVENYIKRIISDGYGVPFHDITPVVERLTGQKRCYICNDVKVKLFLKFEDDNVQEKEFILSLTEAKNVSQATNENERNIKLINGKVPPAKKTTRTPVQSLLQLTRGTPSSKFELTLTKKAAKEKLPKAKDIQVEKEDGL